MAGLHSSEFGVGMSGVGGCSLFPKLSAGEGDGGGAILFYCKRLVASPISILLFGPPRLVRRQQVVFVLTVLMAALCCGIYERRGGRGAGGGLITLAEGHSVRLKSPMAGEVSSSDRKVSFERRLLQGSALASPACATILNSSVITECKAVLEHYPDSAFLDEIPLSADCAYDVRSIVLSPDESALYYTAAQHCFSPVMEIALTSIMKATSAGPSGVAASSSSPVSAPGPLKDAPSELLSHLWPVTNLSGPSPTSPVLITNDTRQESIVITQTAAISSDGKHLMVGAFPFLKTETSWIVSLDVSTGERSSVPVKVGSIYGMALNPDHTLLYISDGVSPSRLLTAHINGSSPPPAELTPELFMALNSFSLSSPMFGPYSFTADGSCLYIMDNAEDIVWGLEPAISRLTPLAGGGSPVPLMVDDYLAEIVSTSDGRQVFFTEKDGDLHLLTLDSACGAPLSHQIIARAGAKGLHGIAITPDDKYLYVGTRGDGRILRLSLTHSSSSSNTPTITQPSTPHPVQPSDATPSSPHPAPNTMVCPPCVCVCNRTAFSHH